MNIEQIMALADAYAADEGLIAKGFYCHLHRDETRTALESALREALAPQPQEIEALRKDALRYRWLRSDELGEGEWSVFSTPMVIADDEVLVGDALDAAIDAAMGAPVAVQPSHLPLGDDFPEPGMT